jgi:hypothetical protein
MNQSDSHLKRTTPAQSEPIRNPIAPPRKSPEPVAFAGAAVCGALENGVRTAYAVIDDYMRRGQEAARGIYNDSNRRGPMNENRGSFNGGFNPMNPFATATEQWMTAMRAWGQVWSGFVPEAWMQQGMNPFANNGGGASTVSVKVSSARPVEVVAIVNPGPDALQLVSEPLLAQGFPAPPIEPPSIGREAGVLRVSVNVEAQQPAGRYSGVVRKKTDGLIAGELIVVIT